MLVFLFYAFSRLTCVRDCACLCVYSYAYPPLVIFTRVFLVSAEEAEALDKHLVRTVCADLLNAVIQDQALHNCLPIDKVDTHLHA